MKVLLFTGAGASVELGVPAMKDMARDLYFIFWSTGVAGKHFGAVE